MNNKTEIANDLDSLALKMMTMTNGSRMSAVLTEIKKSLESSEELESSGDSFYQLSFSIRNARAVNQFIEFCRFDKETVDNFSDKESIVLAVMYEVISGFDANNKPNEDGEIWISDDEIVEDWALSEISPVNYALHDSLGALTEGKY